MTNIDRRMFNGSLLGGLFGLGVAKNTDPVESTNDKTCNPNLLVADPSSDLVASGTYIAATGIRLFPGGVIISPTSGVLIK